MNFLSPFLKRRLMQNSIQINLIPHLRTIRNQIIEQSRIVPAVRWSCTIVVEHMGPMTRPWSSNKAQHWGGVGHRACVCVCVWELSIIQADGFDMSGSVSGWGHYAWSRTAAPSHQHKHTHTYIHTGAWAHKQSHTRTSFYGNSKQTLCACGDPTPAEKRERPRHRGKNRHKSEIESQSGDEGNSKKWDSAAAYASLYVVFIAETFKKDHTHRRNPSPYVKCFPLPIKANKLCWTFSLNLHLYP